MKKTLICVGNLHEHISHETHTLYLDHTTILTPAARDELVAKGVKIELRVAPENQGVLFNLCCEWTNSVGTQEHMCLAASLGQFGWGSCGNSNCKMQKKMNNNSGK